MPGYLFVQMPYGPLDFWALRRCDGVKKVLGKYNEDHDIVPTAIPSRLVERLMAAQLNMEFDDTREAKKRRGERVVSIYQPGVKISVTKGPFASFGAEIDMVRANGTIAALIEIFGRMTPVELTPDQVELAA
jgi:transcription antitermination factor NusG